MKDKIENNPTFDSKVITSEELTEAEQSFYELSILPDRYNELFLDKGQIAHESISLEVM